MQLETFLDKLITQLSGIANELMLVDTYLQLGVIVGVYIVAYVIALKIKNSSTLITQPPDLSSHPIRVALYGIDKIVFPLLAIILLKFGQETGKVLFEQNWVLTIALTIAVLLFFNTLINKLVGNGVLVLIFKSIGLPLLFLHMVGWLDDISAVLKGIAFSVGNINISAYGLARVIIFGSFIFWLGRVSNTFGQEIIRKQERLDVPTREIFAKLFEVTLFCIVFIVLLNIMGINLTALAVFGGALGVGLGFGLQSIASNFISGIIILLDRSLTVGDFVEMEDGISGFVREFRMRYTVLETYDGKDVMVPNEKFISTTFTNWSHKDPKQRYRVDFSVAYSTDIRTMVDMVKEVVASHPQVLSGEQYPIELRPDCEIDGFGDSGVNMFVEFWMEGIDDGKNRVGGDLLLMIFEALREHDIEIPFPQREVRILNEKYRAGDEGEAIS